MKNLLPFLFILTAIIPTSLLGQEHQHVANPDITCFHDAKDALNGVHYPNYQRQQPWVNFVSKHPGWGARFNHQTRLPHRAIGSPITFSPGGSDAVAKAKAFIEQELKDFGIDTKNLTLTNSHNDGKYINVNFKQFYQQKEILWSRVTVRFNQALQVVMFGTDYYQNIPSLDIAITPQEAITFAETALKTSINHSTVEPTLKILPKPGTHGLEFRAVYAVTVNTQDDKETPGIYLTYVDAGTGNILYRKNKVLHFDFNVKGSVYPIGYYTSPITQLPLRNLKTVIGGTTYYTDNNGDINLSTTGPISATMHLEGKWCKIVTGASGSVVNSYTDPAINQGQVIDYPLTGPNATERHTNCYYHVNLVHDYMKSKFPAFTGLDISLLTRVDRTDGNCNAFYNGSSINFYTTANGCNALSLVSDVVYHEYGHGISDKFWTAMGSSFDNGGMGEGYSDVWGMCIIKSPIIGGGFYVGAPASSIRRYDQTPKVYPTDIVGEVHADGEIIAGAWWDVAINMSTTLGVPLSDAVDTMSNIFAGSQFGLATGPDGTEGQVYFDILIDALQYDDDNSNLNDGTPHFNDIVKAFGRHGIFLLSDSRIADLTSDMQMPGNTFSVNTDVTASFPAFIGDVKMFYRLKGSTTIDSLILTGTHPNYTANFPVATNAGDIYEYYISVEDIAYNKSAFGPENGQFGVSFSQRNLPYYLLFGYQTRYKVDFETPLSADWTVGNHPGNNATAGVWTVAVPVSSRTSAGDTVQTGQDHTLGIGKCAVTGNAASANSSAGTADVDNGHTTFVSEEFDFSGFTKPVVSLYRWYSNSQSTNPRKDKIAAYLVYTGAASILFDRTFQPDVSWRRSLIQVDKSIGTKARLHVVASDSVQGAGGALVEAAIDDIEILDLAWPTQLTHQDFLQTTVLPNPASNQITIYGQEQGKLMITLYNAVGGVVRKEVINRFQQQHSLDIKDVANGLYVVKMEMNGKTAQQKLTISK